MTTATVSRAWPGVAAVVIVWAAAWSAVVWQGHHEAVTIAAAFDFVVTASVALWLVSRRQVSRRLLAATVVIGAMFARIALGRIDGRAVLVAAGVLELALALMLVARARALRAGYRRARVAGEGGHAALEAGLIAARVPRRLANLIATELYVFAMLVRGWRTPQPAFTVHRANGWSLYAGVFVFLILVEASAAHLLIGLWSPVAAWVATATSIYAALWFIGEALALRQGGVYLRDDVVELRIGVRWRARIPRTAIVSVETAATPDALDLSILGANTVLRLREPVTAHGLFGRPRTAHAIALSLDDRDAFVRALCGEPATQSYSNG
jgi:hypothetical protein